MNFAATDHIADAPDLSVGGTVFSGTAPWDNTTATTNEAGEPTVDTFTNLVWHKVLVPFVGRATFHHDTTVAGDTYMGLFRGPANAAYADLISLGFDDDTAGNGKASMVFDTSAPDQWLYIASTGFGSSRLSGQGLVWTVPPPSGPYAHAFGATDVRADTRLPPVSAPRYQLQLEAGGESTVSASAELDGEMIAAAYAQARTAVRVTPVGKLQGQLEADGTTLASVSVAMQWQASAEADGVSRVMLIYAAPIFGDPDSDHTYAPDAELPAPMAPPISISMNLRGTCLIVPPPLELA